MKDIIKITIADWMGGNQLVGSGFIHNQIIDGTVDNAFQIARQLFDHGLAVMIKFIPERNIGTKKQPVISPESLIIWVDTKRFQQR